MPEKGGRICKRIERFSCQAVTFGSSITPRVKQSFGSTCTWEALRVKQSRLEVQAFEKHNSIATLKAVSLQAKRAGRVPPLLLPTDSWAGGRSLS